MSGVHVKRFFAIAEQKISDNAVGETGNSVDTVCSSS
jgi:hypothetical protein